jgi:hypothetical protein
MSATSALAAAPIETTDKMMQPEDNEVDAATETTPPTEQQPAASEEPAKAPPAVTQTSDESALATAQRANERDQAVARIRQSALPPALRERLAAVVEAGQSANLDVAACLEALEETLPDFLRASRNNVMQPVHPGGDAFFKSGDDELTDAEAETIAQRQLARSGLLRGQRVKVAD